MSPRRHSMRATAVTGALALTAVAGGCSGSSPRSISPPGGATSITTATSAPSSSTTSAAGSLPPAGVYTDGPQGTPHYTVDLTSSSTTALSGSVTFTFQDGRTQTVFTFTGTPSAGKASLTTSTGKTLSAAYTGTSILLESCTAYLQYAASDSQCTFSGSASG
jgi:hypothetical protein